MRPSFSCDSVVKCMWSGLRSKPQESTVHTPGTLTVAWAARTSSTNGHVPQILTCKEIWTRCAWYRLKFEFQLKEYLQQLSLLQWVKNTKRCHPNEKNVKSYEVTRSFEPTCMIGSESSFRSDRKSEKNFSSRHLYESASSLESASLSPWYHSKALRVPPPRRAKLALCSIVLYRGPPFSQSRILVPPIAQGTRPMVGLACPVSLKWLSTLAPKTRPGPTPQTFPKHNHVRDGISHPHRWNNCSWSCNAQMMSTLGHPRSSSAENTSHLISGDKPLCRQNRLDCRAYIRRPRTQG